MSNEEAKEFVSAGLLRRRIIREEREQALEDQARQLRLTINDNHTARTLTEAQRKELAKAEAQKRREARAVALAQERAREDAATLAVQRYVMACIGTVLVAMLTPFPWWAAAALALGLAVFPVAYIFRLYFLKQETSYGKDFHR